MRYMFLLFHGDESQMPDPSSPEELAAIMEPWNAYNAALREAGVYIAGDALQHSRSATTLRGSGADLTVTDGPFAETKEQIGGYYMVDCPDLDEALKWAKRCPMLAHGSVEVRPLAELPTE